MLSDKVQNIIYTYGITICSPSFFGVVCCIRSSSVFYVYTVMQHHTHTYKQIHCMLASFSDRIFTLLSDGQTICWRPSVMLETTRPWDEANCMHAVTINLHTIMHHAPLKIFSHAWSQSTFIPIHHHAAIPKVHLPSYAYIWPCITWETHLWCMYIYIK